MKKNYIFVSILLSFLLVGNKVTAMMCCHAGEHHHEEKVEKKKAKAEIKESFYSTIYTCPMHPEIRQEKPGNCPKCKMELQKKQILMTYACPEEDCEIQKVKPGKCPKCGKELIKCEIKSFCQKCSEEVEESQLIKPKKEDIKLRRVRNEEIGKKVFCPVMKKEFVVSKKTKAVDYNDKSYYLCCDFCEKEILKNPQKYIIICPRCGEQVNPEDLKQKPIKSLKSEVPKEEKPTFRDVTADEIGKEAVCVVMNKKFKVSQKAKVAVYKGREYYLCCPGCDTEFIKDPEKFIR